MDRHSPLNNIILRSQCLQRAGVPNANGDVFTEACLRDIARSTLANPKVHGHIGPTYDGKVHMSEVSHKVEGIRYEGDALVGDVHVLNTYRGKILTGLLELREDAWEFALSGHGTTTEDGTITAFKLFSVDVVPAKDLHDEETFTPLGRCCPNEQRNISGGCDNCGDPCY